MSSVASAPTSDKPPFWQRQPNTSGDCDERILSQVWTLNVGLQHEHWNLYAAYSQEHLRQEIVSNWHAWLAVRPVVSYVPWVWALKVYLWRFPLDTALAEELRLDMGPFWLIHVRHSEEDWLWLYSMRTHIPVNALVPLLGLLPAHPVGQALVVDFPPAFEGYHSRELQHHKQRLQIVLAQPAVGLLENYGDVLLHPAAHFYPRWRALLVCLHNSLRALRKEKKKPTNSLVQNVLEKSCAWLDLTPRTLWKGFDPDWVAFAKERNCTSLDLWDAAVVDFSAPKDWRQRLRAEASAKEAVASAILA